MPTRPAVSALLGDVAGRSPLTRCARGPSALRTSSCNSGLIMMLHGGGGRVLALDGRLGDSLIVKKTLASTSAAASAVCESVTFFRRRLPLVPFIFQIGEQSSVY